MARHQADSVLEFIDDTLIYVRDGPDDYVTYKKTFNN
jgi:hypothetical protein